MKSVVVTLVFILADLAVGIFQAVVNKTFATAKMRQGLVHKATEILCIILGLLVQWGLPTVGIEINAPVVPILCGYIVVMELASIVENLARMNENIKNIVTKVFGNYVERK